jgi:hypothetical protein
MQIFTIGYEGAIQPELIEALKTARVELLADIRAVPLSRRPGISKNILANGLRDAGIDYVGMKSLGTPAEGARRRDGATTGRSRASMPASSSCRKRSRKERSYGPWPLSDAQRSCASSASPLGATGRC